MNLNLFWQKNGSWICSILGVSGVIASNVLTANATKKAVKEDNIGLTKKQLFKKHYKKYIAPTVVAIATIGAVSGAKMIDARKQAELAASLLAAKATYTKYRGTVEKVIGKEKMEEIKQLFNEEKLVEDNDNFRIPAKPANDSRLLYWIGYGYNDYFWSTPSEIERAEGVLNKILHQGQQACPNDFLDALGLEGTEEGFINGWGIVELYDVLLNGWITVDETVTTHDDGLEVHILEFNPFPVSNYDDETRPFTGESVDYVSLSESYNDGRYQQGRTCDVACEKYEQKIHIT